MSPKPRQTNVRFEWISLVYLLFFMMAVLTPSLVSGMHFGFNETRLEEFLIFMMGLSGIVTFTIYERVLERREKERDEATNNAERATKELIDSYKYIGSINRQIDVLKQVANETSMKLVKNDPWQKDLLQSLLTSAASVANAERLLLRYVEVDKLRTEREHLYSTGEQKSKIIKVANKDLKRLADQASGYAFMRTEDGDEIVVVPSDRKQTKILAFLVIATDPSRLTDLDISLLKVFVNQAELISHHLLTKEALPTNPIQHVQAVTATVKGEVGE